MISSHNNGFPNRRHPSPPFPASLSPKLALDVLHGARLDVLDAFISHPSCEVEVPLEEKLSSTLECLAPLVPQRTREPARASRIPLFDLLVDVRGPDLRSARVVAQGTWTRTWRALHRPLNLQTASPTNLRPASRTANFSGEDVRARWRASGSGWLPLMTIGRANQRQPHLGRIARIVAPPSTSGCVGCRRPHGPRRGCQDQVQLFATLATFTARSKSFRRVPRRGFPGDSPGSGTPPTGSCVRPPPTPGTALSARSAISRLMLFSAIGNLKRQVPFPHVRRWGSPKVTSQTPARSRGLRRSRSRSAIPCGEARLLLRFECA